MPPTSAAELALGMLDALRRINDATEREWRNFRHFDGIEVRDPLD